MGREELHINDWFPIPSLATFSPTFFIPNHPIYMRHFSQKFDKTMCLKKVLPSYRVDNMNWKHIERESLVYTDHEAFFIELC